MHEGYPVSVKVLGEIHYSPILRGWVVETDDDSLSVFASKEDALKWLEEQENEE